MRAKLFISCVLVGFLATPAALEAKDNPGKNVRTKVKRTESRASDDHWPRETRSGHQPKDQNGDGVVTRNEWPGNDDAFRELDRNGDGVLSSADRELRPRDGRVHKRTR
jgi:hypothetical protein